MPAPYEVIPRMEGTIGSLAGGQQSLAEWVKMAKIIMLSARNKDQTDWDFLYEPTVIQATSAVRVGATTVYGAVFGSINAAGEFQRVYITDIAAGDFVGTAVDTDDWVAFQLPACAVAGVEEFTSMIFPKGIVLAAGLDTGADGNAGTNPGATDIRGWFLVRLA